MYTFSNSHPVAYHYQNNFSSNDLEETKKYISKTIRPHTLTLLDRTQTLHAQIGSTTLGSTSFMYVHHGADVHVYPGKLETIFLIQIPLRTAKYEVRVGDTQICAQPGIAYVVSPTLDFELSMSHDCNNLIIAIERRQLEIFLEQQLQMHLSRPLEFEPRINVLQQSGSQVVELISYLIRQLDSTSPGLANNAISHRAESFLFSTIINTLPHNHSRELIIGAAVPKPRHIKRAIDYINENAHLLLTPEDLAREVNVSVRSLYAGFQSFLKCTPMGYLKKIRLEKIHYDLSHSEPHQTSVAEVAAKYRMTSPGNFAASYRARFGELPSDTLSKRQI